MEKDNFCCFTRKTRKEVFFSGIVFDSPGVCDVCRIQYTKTKTLREAMFLGNDSVDRLIENWKKENEFYVPCKFCGGSGLQGFSKNDYGYSWNGEFCDKCQGKGKVDFIEDMLLGGIGDYTKI